MQTEYYGTEATVHCKNTTSLVNIPRTGVVTVNILWSLGISVELCLQLEISSFWHSYKKHKIRRSQILWSQHVLLLFFEPLSDFKYLTAFTAICSKQIKDGELVNLLVWRTLKINYLITHIILSTYLVIKGS